DRRAALRAAAGPRPVAAQPRSGAAAGARGRRRQAAVRGACRAPPRLGGVAVQVRLVGLFSLIAVLPTIIVAVFSYLFFSFGVESWFSDKVRTAISESVAVADAYVRQHQQAIRADALAMAADLDRSAATLAINPQYLAPALTAQAAIRSLTEAAVVDRRGQMVARTGLAFALGFEDVSQG